MLQKKKSPCNTEAIEKRREEFAADENVTGETEEKNAAFHAEDHENCKFDSFAGGRNNGHEEEKKSMNCFSRGEDIPFWKGLEIIHP